MDAFSAIMLGVIFWSLIMLAITLVNLKKSKKDKGEK